MSYTPRIITREEQAFAKLENTLAKEAKNSDLAYVLIAVSKKHNLNFVSATGTQQRLRKLFKIAKKKIIR